MDPTPELAAQLDRDRREAAEAMTFEQRLLAGPALFDLGVAMMRCGIRLQHPDFTDEQIEQVVEQRLNDARRFEATL